MLDTTLRRPDVERATGLTRSSIYERMATGTFPKPIRLGEGRAVGWLQSEIERWQKERKAERDKLVASRRQRATRRRRGSH